MAGQGFDEHIFHGKCRHGQSHPHNTSHIGALKAGWVHPMILAFTCSTLAQGLTEAVTLHNNPPKFNDSEHDVFGQCFFWLHIDSHIQRLQLALRTRDGREALGQIFRLSLVPFGHLLGRLPIGNPGTADVSAFSTQEIPTVCEN